MMLKLNEFSHNHHPSRVKMLAKYIRRGISELDFGGKMIHTYRFFRQFLPKKHFSFLMNFSLSIVVLLLASCGVTTTIKHPTPTILIAPTATAYYLPILIEKVKPVTNGQGIPEAAEFIKDAEIPHKILIVSISDAGYDPISFWNNQIPSSWLAKDVNEIELVILVEEQTINLGSQKYFSGGKDFLVSRIRYDLKVNIFEARSGKMIDATIFSGGEPRQFSQVEYTTKLFGEHVVFETLLAWMCEKGYGPCEPDEPEFFKLRAIDNCIITSDLDFSPDGKTLAITCMDGEQNSWLSLWNIENYNRFFEINIGRFKMSEYFFSPDSQFLYTNVDNGVIRIKITDPTNQEILANPEEILALSPNGLVLVSQSPENSQDVFSLKLWQTSDGSLIQSLDGYTNYIMVPAISLDGTYLASADLDDNVLLWNIRDGKLINQIPNISGNMAFSPDNEFLIISSSHEPWLHSELKNSVSVWHVTDGSLVYNMIRDDSEQCKKYLAVSPKGEIIASGLSFDTVYLTQLIDGTLLNTLQHENRVIGAEFSPNGQIIATWEERGKLYLWRVEDGLLIATLDEGTADDAKFSPDGRLLAVSYDPGEVIIWNINYLDN
ncbi:MAG: hypothetical protein JXA13_13920 [Anaerolineales bacterium]|nr:hypothetical protein [Anaerolineales bacterium]